jgi:hypothetical protein
MSSEDLLAMCNVKPEDRLKLEAQMVEKYKKLGKIRR